MVKSSPVRNQPATEGADGSAFDKKHGEIMKDSKMPGRFFFRYPATSFVFLTVSLSVISILSGLSGCTAGRNVSSGSPPAADSRVAAALTPRVPDHFTDPARARPLPKVLDPRQFDEPVVRAAYEYARLNPEIFAQQPCYCYCDQSNGHRSLLDCYATSHSAT